MHANTRCLIIVRFVMITCLCFEIPSCLSVQTYGSVIKTTETREFHIGLNADGSLTEPEKVPCCENGQRIILISYMYHQLQCRIDHECVSTHKEPLLPAEERLLHNMCSMRQECSHLSFPLRSDAQKNTTNSVAIAFECIDQNQQANICEETVRYFGDTLYLTSVDVKDPFTECYCFVNKGRFSVSVTDVRLTKNVEMCSQAKLLINFEEFLCDPNSEDYGSFFRGRHGEPLNDAYISLSQNSSTAFPDMILVTLRPESSSMLICNDPKETQNNLPKISTSAATAAQSNISSTTHVASTSVASDDAVKSIFYQIVTSRGISSSSGFSTRQDAVLAILIIILVLLVIIIIIGLVMINRKYSCFRLWKRDCPNKGEDTRTIGINKGEDTSSIDINKGEDTRSIGTQTKLAANGGCDIGSEKDYGLSSVLSSFSTFFRPSTKRNLRLTRWNDLRSVSIRSSSDNQLTHTKISRCERSSSETQLMNMLISRRDDRQSVPKRF